MTKPVTNIPEWADDSNGGNYTGGPYAGQPRKVSIPGAIAAEGFRPGAADPSAAEHVNDWLNQLSKWITWVFDGTSSPAESAHLVETTSGGRIQAQWGSFYASTAAAPYSLSSQAPAASGNALLLYADAPNADALISALHDNSGMFAQFEGGAGIAMICHGDGNDGLELSTDGALAFGIVVTTSGAGADGARITTTGNGADGIVISATGDNLSGVSISVDSSTAYGITAIGLNDGGGGRFIGGVSSGFGILVEGKAAEGISCTGGTGPTVPALRSTGKVNAPGGRFQGGPSGADGVQGFGIGNNAAGCYGESPRKGVSGKATDGASGSFGVLGVADGNASGGGFVSVNGPALQADSTLGTGKAISAASTSGVAVDAVSTSGTTFAGQSTSGHAAFLAAAGTRATMRLDPRSTNPGAILEGGLWSREAQGLMAHIAKNGGGAVARHLFDTAGGMAFAADYESGPGTTDVQATVVSAAMTGNNAPVTTGTVMIIASVELGRENGTSDVSVKIYDLTDNVPIPGMDKTIQLFETGAGVLERHAVFVGPYTLPAAGSRTFGIVIEPDPNPDDINWSSAGICVVGVF